MNDGVPVLTIRDLDISRSVDAGHARLVDGVSLDVFRKRITCLVGASGSGKSLTASAVMRLLPGVLRIERGQICLDGEELTAASRSRLQQLRGDRVAMVFQEPMTALNPVMRIGDQIAEVFQLHRPRSTKAAIDARVIQLMTDVDLPDPRRISKAFPHQLSGGQRQRVMIAMALALEPALIIADEPTTALDVTTQAQILKLFRELLTKHDSGILLITHDFGVVSDVADHVVVMCAGKIVEQGKPETVLRSPSHPYTRSLIEAVPSFRFREDVVEQSAPVLAVKKLSLTYRDRSLFGGGREVKALDDVSFTLARGETLGIVGESGSGKSTLAKCLLRFERPNSGEVLVDGRDLTRTSGSELRAARRRVQMIFQDPYRSLNPRRTVGQSMTEGPMQEGVSHDLAFSRAADLLSTVGLERGAMDRFPHEFSGGQRQRICIARALAMDPTLIVADEPVSALDVLVQQQVLEILRKLRDKMKLSMVFITHDLRIASNICDRIAVMKQGRIIEIGPTSAVFRNPQSEYARRLLAAVPGKDAWIG